MKKFLLVFSMIFVLCFSFAGCGSSAVSTEENGDVSLVESEGDTVSEVVNIAVLNGPTGMGAVKLMDMTDKYNVTTYQAATDVVPKLISGEVDVACLPSNMAAVLYQKTEGQVVAISPMVMGVLHILGNDTEDIKTLSDLEGMTIVSAGQGGTPEYALQKIIENAGLSIGDGDKDVHVEWLASHADVNTRLLTEPGCIAMVPEPFVSVALSKGQTQGIPVSELFDLNEEWQKATGQDFPMGILIAGTDFVTKRAADLEITLGDLMYSINEVNGASSEICELLVERGFFSDATIAKKAIPNCNLCLYTGDNKDEGRQMLRTFNETMYEVNPASVGGELPGDDLYY